MRSLISWHCPTAARRVKGLLQAAIGKLVPHRGDCEEYWRHAFTPSPRSRQALRAVLDAHASEVIAACESSVLSEKEWEIHKDFPELHLHELLRWWLELRRGEAGNRL